MTQQIAICYRCHRPLLDANAHFCDTCGFPQDPSCAYQLRSELQKSVDTLTSTVDSLKDEKSQLKGELDELKELIAQVKSLPQAEQIVFPQKIHKIQQQMRKPVREKIQKSTGHVESHLFVYMYQGKGDWQNQLADFAQEHGIIVGFGGILASAEKIVFTARGTRQNLEKFLGALEKADFANLRLRIALAKRTIAELENVIETDKKALATLNGNVTSINSQSQYKRIFRRGLGKRKKELVTRISQLSSRMNENIRKYTEAQESLRRTESIITSASSQFQSMSSSDPHEAA